MLLLRAFSNRPLTHTNTVPPPSPAFRTPPQPCVSLPFSSPPFPPPACTPSPRRCEKDQAILLPGAEALGNSCPSRSCPPCVYHGFVCGAVCAQVSATEISSLDYGAMIGGALCPPPPLLRSLAAPAAALTINALAVVCQCAGSPRGSAPLPPISPASLCLNSALTHVPFSSPLRPSHGCD